MDTFVTFFGEVQIKFWWPFTENDLDFSKKGILILDRSIKP